MKIESRSPYRSCLDGMQGFTGTELNCHFDHEFEA